MANQPSGRLKTSWGDKVGTDGYFVASDAWMDEYTYQIVVRKELLTAEEQAAYEAEPIVLAPWDPNGSLGRIILFENLFKPRQLRLAVCMVTDFVSFICNPQNSV